jgi:hypothetical protein
MSSERVSVNLERRRQEGPKKYNGMVMPLAHSVI